MENFFETKLCYSKMIFDFIREYQKSFLFRIRTQKELKNQKIQFFFTHYNSFTKRKIISLLNQKQIKKQLKINK